MILPLAAVTRRPNRSVVPGSPLSMILAMKLLLPPPLTVAFRCGHATTLIAVINQGLFRKLCDCAQHSDDEGGTHARLDEEQLAAYLGHSLTPDLRAGLRHAKGCQRCEHTGYRERVAVHETIMCDIDEKERAAAANEVARGGSISALLQAAGVRTIRRRDVALRLLGAGLIDAATALTSVDARASVEHVAEAGELA